MSLLTIVQGACGQLNLSQPTAAFTSSDLQVGQIIALAKAEGKELTRRYDWQVLQKEGSFTTVATEIQVADITATFSDFLRIVNQTMWDRSQDWMVFGPLNASQWQRRKARLADAGIRNYFRMRGNAILFNPVPAAGKSIFFEYISKNWCLTAGTTLADTWTTDTDAAVIDEEIIRLGVVWRWLKAKGLDYAEEFRTYEMALESIFGADAGKQIIDMGGELDPLLGVNIPEANWGLP